MPSPEKQPTSSDEARNDIGLKASLKKNLAHTLARILGEANLVTFVSNWVERSDTLAKAVSKNAKVKGAIYKEISDHLSQDVQFLIKAATKEETKKSFFGASIVRKTATSFTGIREEVMSNHDLLVSKILQEDNGKKFFSDSRIRQAATSFTSIRDEIAKFTSVRDEIASDNQFLIDASLRTENKNAFYRNPTVKETYELVNPATENRAVNILSKRWTNRRRQVDGFSLYLSMLQRLQDYYGNCEPIRRVEAAPIPEAGFPSVIHLRDFLCTHLCDGKTFFMRDAKLEIVDEHAIWTLIHEILIDEEYYFETDKDAPFIIDCGANFGMSTIYFKQLYPNARVVAFEPVPWLCQLARDNVKNNGFDNVEIVEKGLSAEAGEATFFVSRDYSMAGSLTDRRVKFGDEIEEITIKTVPLGDYIDREVDFLKIDIEGSEGDVIISLGEKLSLIKSMCVEWHLRPSGDDIIRLEQVLTLLADNGFDYQIGKSGNYAKRSKLKPMTHVGDLGTLNFWAKRR